MAPAKATSCEYQIGPSRDRSANPARGFDWKGCDAPQMPINPRQVAVVLAIACAASTLSACGTINEKIAGGVADIVPQWAGGLPADAPPRPGSAKYEEFMRERERKRLEPAPPKDEAAQSSANALAPVH